MSELSAFQKTATWSLLGYSGLRPPQERIECQVLVLTQQRHTLVECPACQALEKLSFLALPSWSKLAQGPVKQS